ncbi:MAG: chorismate mutase [Desulfurococcales archaeon]|nr:chorismate mutase [Desulfurococcales archaeon]
MGLEELRKEIDELDEQILKLIARRKEVVKEIARIKKARDLPVVDVERERAHLKILKILGNELGLEPDEVELVFKVLILISIMRQVTDL